MAFLLRQCIIFLILAAFSGASFAFKDPSKESLRFITLADIHFDPFSACRNANMAPCTAIKALQKADVSEWSEILARYDTEVQQYRFDTNYSLLTSTLNAAKQMADKKNVQFVLVLGDFLAHNFRFTYIKYSGDYSRAGYQTFVKKTFQFLTNELNKAFPTIDVFPVIGNNDSYHQNYSTSPNSRFLKEIESIWMNLIKDKANRLAMQESFNEAGYYAVDQFKDAKLRLVVLNSVLFSYKARGSEIHQAAHRQLSWLENELAEAKDKGEKVFIAMHIPAGIDVYASLQFRMLRLIELWKTEYTKEYESILKTYAKPMGAIFAGHLHSDWFQILTLSNENRIPILGTPAISPAFGNNPSFKIYTYSFDSEELLNVETYYYPLDKTRSWGLEYDFKRIYQLSCFRCPMIYGLDEIRRSGYLSNQYKRFYAVSTNSQPIHTKWYPYYWCLVQGIDGKKYQACISNQ